MKNEKPILCPFKILIDTAENHFFSFENIKADADKHNRTITIETEFRCLQRHPDSLGDYAPDCGVGRCHVERKSMEDCQGTILGFDGRRQRFESELANLAAIEAGVVIVECSRSSLMANAPDRGKKTKQQNAKTLFRSILAYQQDYKGCQWIFCDGRRLAELAAFRWMWRWFHNMQAEQKSAMKRQQLPIFDSELASI